jgi:predicted porin
LLAQQQGLQPVAQIQQGRQESTGFTITPNASYQFSRLWSASAAYSYSLFTQQDSPSITSNVFTLGTSRLFTPADTGTLNYYFRAYESSLGSSTSNALTVGWTHLFSQFTSVTARAGPRVTDGQLGPEVFMSAQHRLKFIELSASYVMTQAVDLGQGVPVTTHTLAGAANFQLSRFLQVSIGPSFQTWSNEGQSDVGTTYYYSVNASATYWINKWLSARAAYSWTLQTGAGGDIPRNLVGVGLTVAYPMRID